MTEAKTIMIVAGEASGDMHGASLVREMLKINPSLSFYGIGGCRLKEAGVKLLADASAMAVVGLTEVISKLGSVLKIMSRMKKTLDTCRPDLVILIDYPDFNLPLARAAHKRGIKIFYYISPQVWAWRKGRIKQIKKFVDRMAVILPFEVDVYGRKGFGVHYVGHPLLDAVGTDYSRDQVRREFGFDKKSNIIALLPGSRKSEVVKLLLPMMRAAEIIAKEIPGTKFILPLAETLDKKTITDIISGFAPKVDVLSGRTYDVVSCADLAVVASGTATLETALLKVPMIIIYKISPISYFIGKMAISVENIGLVNIIAGKTIVPELIQQKASGENIAAAALAILQDNQKKQEMINNLGLIREKLGSPGVALRAAKLACDMIV
jgi:lipid-A-disaccharide synthase